MERIMKAQALRDNNTSSVMMSKKIMEINPHHGIIKSLKDRINLATNEHMIKDLVNLLYESSLISSGFSIEEPATFVNRINNMIKIGLSIEDDEVDNMKEDDEKKEDGTKDGEEKEDVDVSQSNMEEID
jgi:molecular chaperone HtpG